MKTHYELLEVPADAPADEIKRAFRREIAKYHPDKVQHLGTEFQEIAAIKAAELTQAYKTLTDPVLRADYDAILADGGLPEPTVTEAPPASHPPATEKPRERPVATPPPTAAPPSGGMFSQEREGVTEFIRRATVARVRAALLGEFGSFEEQQVPGFEVTCVPKPAFWKKTPPRVLVRIVPVVDGAAVSEAWGLAGKMKKDGQREVCVFLMGPAMAAAGELASAIAEQRRRSSANGGKLTVIPVSTRNWMAHVPTDAPPVVRSLLARLKS